MDVRTDCRHYSTRSISTGEVVQRCRVDANLTTPFSCPPDCLFFEERELGGAYQWPRGGTGGGGR